MNHIEILRAEKKDVEAIVRLINAGGPEGKPRTELPHSLPEEYYDAFDAINSDPNQFLAVAKDKSSTIGTFHMSFITYLHAQGHPDCQIEAIHVAASYRNQGVGTSLLKWAIQKAKEKKCRRIQLTSDKRRKSAHQFYERLGFKFTHEGAKLQLI